MRPLVSILIPAFNAQNWIAETLESAIAQTWPEREIIVVDDGSTDQTLAIAKRFEPADVRIVTQKNQGAAAARNTAFSQPRRLHPVVGCRRSFVSQQNREPDSRAAGRFGSKHTAFFCLGSVSAPTSSGEVRSIFPMVWSIGG
jgi:GT2 family glycosyltransferase